MIIEGDRPWALGKAFQRAKQRCIDIAESERILGYDENYRVYSEIAGEIGQLSSWVVQEAAMIAFRQAA